MVSWKESINKNYQHFRVNSSLMLSLRVYGGAKMEWGLFQWIKDNFTTNDIVYDIVQSLVCEFGSVDLNHEKFIKHLEWFYGRDLTLDELTEYANSLRDSTE